MPQKPPPPSSRQTSGSGSLLTQKYGPLPGWGWLVIVVAGFYLWNKVRGGSSSGTTTASGGAAGQTPVTASLSLPGGYSYSGPASGAAAFQQTVMGPSPGNAPSATVSPGNTGVAAFQTTSPAQGYVGGGFAPPATPGGPAQPAYSTQGNQYIFAPGGGGPEYEPALGVFASTPAGFTGPTYYPAQ